MGPLPKNLRLEASEALRLAETCVLRVLEALGGLFVLVLRVLEVLGGSFVGVYKVMKLICPCFTCRGGSEGLRF